MNLVIDSSMTAVAIVQKTLKIISVSGNMIVELNYGGGLPANGIGAQKKGVVKRN